MLNRFLNCKRYKYFMFETATSFHNPTPTYGSGHWTLYKDEYRAMTYNEYFSGEQYKRDREYAPK